MQDNLDLLYKEVGSDICLFPFLAGFYSLVVPADRPIVMPCSSVKVINWEVYDDSIIKTMNSDQWRNLRKNFIQGSCHTTDICKTCSLAEQGGGSSPRILNNKYFAEHLDIDLVRTIKQIIDNDYKIDKVFSLDFCPSNYCDYECIMCFGGASSKRKTFEIKIQGGKPSKKNNLKINSDFDQILSTIKILNFTGGETLLQKQIHELIDELIQNDLAKNIKISLLTNASKYPEKLIDHFKQFKDVFYTVSIDGIGEVIEYQRRGAIWSDVESNALRFYKEFGCVINFVLNAVNVFNFPDFVDWLSKHNINKVFISLVYDRNHNISVAVVPPELKSPFIDRLTEYQYKYQNTYYAELIQQMLDIMSNTEHDPKLIPEFIKAITIEDSASKKSLKQVVPEWTPYFK
jgi:MoaA/NifB/PqqE/SkfB family radical SAM enzyme